MSDPKTVLLAALDAAYLRKWADWWEAEGIKEIRARADEILSAK